MRLSIPTEAAVGGWHEVLVEDGYHERAVYRVGPDVVRTLAGMLAEGGDEVCPGSWQLEGDLARVAFDLVHERGECGYSSPGFAPA